jgi:hypothetical protein
MISMQEAEMNVGDKID